MRTFPLCLYATLAALMSMPAVAAQPLTCEAFRDRLDGNLILSKADSAEAPSYRETGTGADGSRRYAWSTPNLEGTLTCGASAEFKEFYVALAVASKERFVEQIKRFVATNGAAICAVSEAPAAVCDDTGKQLLQIGLQQMGNGYQRRVTAPSGTADRMLLPHLKAGMTVAPSLLTFSLDVDEGSVVEAARQPLAPPQSTAAPQ